MNEWVWSIGGIILTGETEVLGERHCTASVVDEWMSVEHWCNDTERGNWSTGRKPCPNDTLSTSNLTWIARIECYPPRWEFGDWPHDTCHGKRFDMMQLRSSQYSEFCQGTHSLTHSLTHLSVVAVSAARDSCLC